MFNPLTRHKSPQSSDMPDEFEAPLTPDSGNYIGKNRTRFLPLFNWIS